MGFLQKKIGLVFFLGIVFILYFPMLLSPQDFWDGDIIMHAFDTHNYSIYKLWFNEAGLHLSSFLYDIFRFTSTGKQYKFFVSLLQISLLITSAIELGKISKLLFGFEGKEKLIVLISFVCTPIWLNLYSSVFLLHIFTIYLALYVVRIFLVGNFKWWHYIVVAVSFQHNSNALLIYSFISAGYVLVQDNRDAAYFKKALLLFIVGTLYFFIYRYFFPAYGLYEDYNQLKLSSLLNVAAYKNFFLTFFELYVFLFLSIFLILIINRSVSLLISVVVICMLIVVNMLPYIVVGKFSTDVVHGWSSRFMFQSVIPLTLLFGFLYKVKFKSVSYFFIVISFLPLLYSFYMATNVKLGTAVYKQDLKLEVERNQLDNGCVVYLRFPQGGRMSSYAINKIFYDSKGFISSVPIIVPYYGVKKYERAYIENEESKIKKIIMNIDYREKYIWPDKYPTCFQDVEVLVDFEKINDLSLYEKLMLLAALDAPGSSILLSKGEVYEK
ncbi:MAG: hypothetical protein JKY50_20190 [Oleispira sp.]|nr:hypothetical protein [Oleispira sp.]